MKRILILLLKILLPLAVLAAAVAGTLYMIESRPEAEKRSSAPLYPKVRVETVSTESLVLTVRSQGTVRARTESRLVPEVSGRVVEVSSSLVSGGFFETDDVLLKIDDRDYRNAIILAEAEVSRTRLRLAQEEAEAEVARKQWDEVGKGEATALTLRVPQIAAAKASVAAAKAALEQAERNLVRTEIKAPFTGRVRSENVDVGQVVTRGTPVALLYAVDVAEVRLPLADRDLAFIDLPLDSLADAGRSAGPTVTLSTTFAGKEHSWRGTIVRTEGEIDATSRLVHVVAEVKDPYGRNEQSPGRPPLAVGMYVRAEIEGYRVDGVAVLPRNVLRAGSRVLTVDSDDRLRFREVEVLRKTRTEIVVSAGLAPGERVCVSPIEAVTDGMRVAVAPERSEREDP